MDKLYIKYDLLKEEWKEVRSSIARFDSISVDLRKYGFTIISGIITASAFFLSQNLLQSTLPIFLATVSIIILIFGLFLIDTYNGILLLASIRRAKDIEFYSQELIEENSEEDLEERVYSNLYLTTYIEASVQTIKARNFTLGIYAIFTLASLALAICFLIFYIYQKNLYDDFFIYYLLGFVAFLTLIAFLSYRLDKKMRIFMDERVVIFDRLVLEKIFDETKIKKSIKELSAKIAADYSLENLQILTIGGGGLVFAPRILSHFEKIGAVNVHILSVFAHKDKNGNIEIKHPDEKEFLHKRVLIVDDLAASGRTISKLKEICEKAGATEVKVCVLLDAPEKRDPKYDRDDLIDYRGISTREEKINLKNEFFVGQGMDSNNRGRYAPFIGILHIKPRLVSLKRKKQKIT